MNVRREVGLLVLVAVVGVSAVDARDFMERPTAIAPGEAPDGFSLMPALYGEVAYHHHSFSDSDTDSFQIRNSVHLGLVDAGRARFGVYYGTFLLSGPVDDESSQGSDLAPWLMNAVQFEYGLSGRVALGVVDVVGDYGRRSYHPLRRGFADPAADILRAGVLVPGRSVAGGALSGALRVRWARLFDFWGSDIPDPRGVWALQPAVEYRHPLLSRPNAEIDAFGLAMSDILLLNDGSLESDVAGQIGVALSGGRSTRGGVGRIEGFFDVYQTADTEEREDRRTPVTLIGLGGRIVFEF